jgi:hypothetical protein
MVCPHCLSPEVKRDSDSNSPAGPLFHRVVLHFECRACCHRFYRANPDLSRSIARVEKRVSPRRTAA